MNRVTSTNVTFVSRFTLPGLDHDYPAGTYRVDVEEEQLDVSFPAFRRVGTTIMLSRGAITLAHAVDPLDLEAALAADKATG